MPNFLAILPRLLVAAVAGVLLFFFLTIGFILAIIIGGVGLIFALIFMRKNKIRFGDRQGFVFTSKGFRTRDAPSQENTHDGPIIDITGYEFTNENRDSSGTDEAQDKPSPNTLKEGLCIDLDPDEYKEQNHTNKP